MTTPPTAPAEGSWDVSTAAGPLHVQLPRSLRTAWPRIVPHLPGAAVAGCGCGSRPATGPRAAGFRTDPDFDTALLPDTAAPDDVRRFLNAVLHCRHLGRGVLTLHAVAAARDDQVLLLLGGHGAGKTLTALALHERGWQPLSGDVSLLRVLPDGSPEYLGGTTAFVVRSAEVARYLPGTARRYLPGPALAPDDTADLAPLLPPAHAAPTARRTVRLVHVRVDQRESPLVRWAERQLRHSWLYQASGHQLDRVLRCDDTPLRCLEPPELTRARLALTTRLADRVPVLSALGTPGQIAAGIEDVLVPVPA
ncbi:hypothetical protein [Kitasatospora sp. NPDC056181]|uniref:hypothetical protein n=1 Tax=Kitasatospora sp. NPDC056181 TaxID=3345737 RepID=UPI0035E1987A